jgi:hypothetical protein
LVDQKEFHLMIFDDFHTALVAPLNNDAYFSHPARPVKVIPENRMDLQSELNTALMKTGAGGVVAVASILDGLHGTEVVVTPVLQIYEVPLVNRGKKGSQKTALNIGVKAMSIWGNRSWSPDRNVWGPMEFKGLDLTEVDPEHGLVIWTLRYEVRTYLETILPLLGNESQNQIFVDEAGRPLLVSPTDP